MTNTFKPKFTIVNRITVGLARREWGHEDYSLQVENLPKAPPPKGQMGLFDVKVNLGDADLRQAKLSHADLSNSDLGRARFDNADLQWADLSGADASVASCKQANLRKAELI